jgi:hypothetical protein
MIKSIMNEKGFESETNLEETPKNHKVSEEKPLNLDQNLSTKVDINVLKARVQEVQNKENRKNILILTLFLLVIGTLGIFFSI